jgi:hypothetical protein
MQITTKQARTDNTRKCFGNFFLFGGRADLLFCPRGLAFEVCGTTPIKGASPIFLGLIFSPLGVCLLTIMDGKDYRGRKVMLRGL